MFSFQRPSRKRVASTTQDSNLRRCNGCRRRRPDAVFVHEGRPDRPYKSCKECRDRRNQRFATQRALLVVPEPSTTRLPMFIEPPSFTPNVMTFDDGPIPTALSLAVTAAMHDRHPDRLMENALSGVPLLTAIPTDLSRQDHPAALAEVPVSEHGAPALIPVSVEGEELRSCSRCDRRCPPTDFVGVTGQRTRSTCNSCCHRLQEQRLAANGTPRVAPAVMSYCEGRI